jgi:3-phosphoshikimate 1-carboxyvinyltransferase
MERVVSQAESLSGAVEAPGDKSLSHRAVIFNAIAEGTATIENFLAGADCLATINILRGLGVEIDLEPVNERSAVVTVTGVGLQGLKEAQDVLNAENSGTTMRLLSGLLAGQPVYSVLTGDASLRSRPMGRVIEPLRAMGASIFGRNHDRLAPLTIVGGGLHGTNYRTPVASAQVKSAIILAALNAEGPTQIVEPSRSRDHTERMLASMGARISCSGTEVHVDPSVRRLRAASSPIPADMSAAAFWLVAASLHPNAEIHLPGVGMNPTRTGVIDVLRAMGADIQVENERLDQGEPAADLAVRSARLHGTRIAGDLIPRVIDEVPVLALAASLAEGETTIADAGELRVKESDRIATTCAELQRLGADIMEQPDGMVIRGVSRLTGAACRSYGDHRLAMTLAIAGLVAAGDTTISGPESVEVSYPGFWTDLAHIAHVPAVPT